MLSDQTILGTLTGDLPSRTTWLLHSHCYWEVTYQQLVQRCQFIQQWQNTCTVLCFKANVKAYAWTNHCTRGWLMIPLVFGEYLLWSRSLNGSAKQRSKTGDHSQFLQCRHTKKSRKKFSPKAHIKSLDSIYYTVLLQLCTNTWLYFYGCLSLVKAAESIM